METVFADICTYHFVAILILPPDLPSTHRLNFLAFLPRADGYDVRLREPPQISRGSVLSARARIRLGSQLIVVFRIFPAVCLRVSRCLPELHRARKVHLRLPRQFLQRGIKWCQDSSILLIIV